MPATSPADEPANDPSRPTELLLESARAGDERAWRELFERYRRMLVVHVEVRMPGSLRRRFDGEDVLQNAFYKAYDRIESFEYTGKGTFRAWLRRIVMHEFTNLLKEQGRARRRQSLEEEDDGSLDEHADVSPRPSQALRDVEERQSLMKGMASLSEEDRDVITMRVFEQLTYPEIGEVLEASRDAAKRRFDRAIARLTREMD